MAAVTERNEEEEEEEEEQVDDDLIAGGGGECVGGGERDHHLHCGVSAGSPVDTEAEANRVVDVANINEANIGGDE